MSICRTLAGLDTLFADNDTGDILPAYDRDFIQTTFGYQATRDPSVLDDSVGTGGTGNFFDVGSRWTNVITLRTWKCLRATPSAAYWQALMYDGEPAGGSLTGTYPNPSITPSGATAGTYGSSTQAVIVTINSEGRITNIANVTISFPAAPVLSVTGTAPITVTPTTGNPVVSHNVSGVTAGSYGDASHWPTFTVDQWGHLTLASIQSDPAYINTVGLTMPADFVVTNSPLTPTGGTINVAYNNVTPGSYLRWPGSNIVPGTPFFGSIILADLPSTIPSAGMSGPFLQWVKNTYTFGNFQAAGTSVTLTSQSLPVGGVLHAIMYTLTPAFSGTGISGLSGSFGFAGGAGSPVSSTTFFGNLTNTTTSFPVSQPSTFPVCRNEGATWSLTTTWSVTGGTLNGLNAGALDVWWLISTLP